MRAVGRLRIGRFRTGLLDKKPLAVCIIALLVALVPTLSGAATVVSPGNEGDWQLTASDGSPAAPPPSALFVAGPSTPPLDVGSLELRLSPAGSDASQARNTAFGGTLLSLGGEPTEAGADAVARAVLVDAVLHRVEEQAQPIGGLELDEELLADVHPFGEQQPHAVQGAVGQFGGGERAGSSKQSA